jgi:hypothetical protein
MRDTNHNGRPDGREDADHDGLNNRGEDETANLPDDRDTDNDGVRDGEENAGLIASFDGTTLTIDLAGGGQVSGTVDSTTEIKCENEDEHEPTVLQGGGQFGEARLGITARLGRSVGRERAGRRPRWRDGR